MIFSLRDRFLTSAKLAELIFFPSFCEICSSLLESPREKVICRTCLGSIIPPRKSFCSLCGRFFNSAGDPHPCSLCSQKPPPFSSHRSLGRYQGMLKDIILLFKYRKFSVIGKDLARMVVEGLPERKSLFQGLKIVVSVPLHPKKKRQRGFNQAEIIAREIADVLEIEYVKDALVKNRNTPPQTSLTADERKRNIRGVFSLKKKEDVKGRRVLLVDDVYTTGATLRECSQVLIRGGAREVRALTLARA